MLIPWIYWNVAMSIDEKSILAHILEQVVIVHAIPFLPGCPVDVRVVEEEDDFFFFHNDPSCLDIALWLLTKSSGYPWVAIMRMNKIIGIEVGGPINRRCAR